MNALELTYGDQVDLTITQAMPYVERAKWLEDYGMDAKEAIQWAKDDILPAIRMPVALPKSWNDMPESCFPSAACSYAAGLAYGEDAKKRVMRALMYANFVLGQDTADDKVLADVVTQLGYDNQKLIDASAGDAIDRAMGEDMQKAGHAANFFSLVVRDNEGTTISLDKAYDPARVERAIDWLAGAKLNKNPRTDVLAYVTLNRQVPIEEIVTVFGQEGKVKIAQLEKSGAVKRARTPLLPDATFYEAA